MTSPNLVIIQSPAHKTVRHVVSGQKYLLKKIIFTCPLLYCRMSSNFSEPFQDASKISYFQLTNISELKMRKHTQREKKTLIHILLINCPTVHHSSLIIFHLLLHYSYTTHYTHTKLLISPQTSFSLHSYSLHLGCIFPLPHPVILKSQLSYKKPNFNGQTGKFLWAGIIYLHMSIPTGLKISPGQVARHKSHRLGKSVHPCLLFPNSQLKIHQMTKMKKLLGPNVKPLIITYKNMVSKSHFLPSNTYLHSKGLEVGNLHLTWCCSSGLLCNHAHRIQKCQQPFQNPGGRTASTASAPATTAS